MTSSPQGDRGPQGAQGLQGITANLNIPVAIHARALIVYYNRTPLYGLGAYLLGYKSGSIEIR